MNFFLEVLTCTVLLFIGDPIDTLGFPSPQLVKNSPEMQEMWLRSLGEEDPLEKEMATHYSILAWEIPWTESLEGYSSWGHEKVGHDLATKQQQQNKNT